MTPIRRRVQAAGAPRYQCVFGTNGALTVSSSSLSGPRVARAFLKDELITGSFFNSFGPREADLGDIAVAVYAADRLCIRNSRNDHEQWGRIMQLTVPVRDPSFWTTTGEPLLRDLLVYLTDDEWHLEFVPFSGVRRPSEDLTLLPEVPAGPATVALFSGGLDSFAGAIDLLTQSDIKTLVTFSARTGNRLGRPQKLLLERIEAQFPNRLKPINARFGLRDRVRHSFDDEERSQRSRGFAFQTFGALCAAAAGLSELLILENGVGAINLPYVDAQLGSQATRAANPVTVAMMSRLVSAVIDRPFSIRLPFAFHTKAQLCGSIRDLGAAASVGVTVSCDHYPRRRHNQHQCGLCSSCLLRRQSLHCSGLGERDDPMLYATDVFTVRSSTKGRDLLPLHCMDMQERAISTALASADPIAALIRRYPAILEAAQSMGAESTTDNLGRLAAMYARYCEEWRAFRSQCPALERAA